MTTTNVQGKILDSKGLLHHLQGEPTDGTEAELKILTVGGSSETVGDILNGAAIVDLSVQLSDGSTLTTFRILDPNGGRIGSLSGNKRTDTPDDIHMTNMRLVMPKGSKFMIDTAN